MTLPTAPAVPIDQVFTRYAFEKVGGREYKNQKYKTRPLLKLLDEKALEGDGGARIVHPVNLGTTKNGKSLARNETFSIVGDSNETWSRYDYSVVIETCFVSWWDIREARGNEYKMQGILDSRIDETQENLDDQVAGYLAASTKAATTDINPILSIIATSGASGEMNPATAGQTLWRAESEANINWSIEGVARARELKKKISNNRGTCDVILLPDQFFNETCEIGDSALVINQDAKTRGGTKYADLGLQVPFILGTPVISDPAWDSAQSSTGVAMDLKGIHLVADKMWDNYIWPFKEMAHHGKLGQATVQLRVCNLTCDSRWTQGLLSSIS